ncbi:MAG TPA: glycoside hydrolase family 15 protein [Candidatus Thermoplasmatota archaeon]|nr:glycoside hydrolase family 15 protein [Candidatus Thermoplasmatota archaeon]
MEKRAVAALDHYKSLSEYGAIGDCRSLALVGADGSIDWWCAPRFDSPAIFAAILDRHRGGRFRVGPQGPFHSVVKYVPGTNVLSTTFRSGKGALEVTDLMPFRGPSRLVRIAEVTQGEVDLEVVYAPRPFYAEVVPRMAVNDEGAVAMAQGCTVALRSTHRLVREGTDATMRIRLVEGEAAAFEVRFHAFERRAGRGPLTLDEARRMRDDTVERWQSWSSRRRYRGPYEREVERSALVLKMLTYEPTGAMVAAGTTSIPERVGGVRNWDYRFAWVRDATLGVHALHATGHADEAGQYVRWLVRVLEATNGELRVLYGIRGETEVPERILPHLEGWRRSAPVRIGNAAAEQHQLDMYGELFIGAHALRRLGNTTEEQHWPVFRRLADWVADHWREPDSGIWEMRSAPKHFVLSKAMAWAALDRAVKAAREEGLDGDVARWEREAAACRAEALERGYDEKLRAFSQAYEAPVLDASNLLLPLIGFIDARDPRMASTIDRVLETLTVNGLVYRYIEDTDDGLPGREATFAYCTFWLVENLALLGRVDEARRIFDGILARANPLGLFAEEVDPLTGELLGNFPQAFPHIGLINAALRLDAASRNEPQAPIPTAREAGR